MNVVRPPIANLLVDAERQAILKWLSEVYFEDHHNLIKSNRHPGSGGWLFEKGSLSIGKHAQRVLFFGCAVSVSPSDHFTHICTILVTLLI